MSNANYPLVSVVMIFLNGEEFLAEAIESVIAQTYPHWELLMVDDGSTDGATAVAQQYAQQYPDQIIYLEHENHANLGKSTSRNLGIHRARGKYMTLLDADDVFLPDKLARQVALLEQHPQAGMVYGTTEYWYSWTKKPEDLARDFRSKLGVKAHTLFTPPELLTKYLADGGMVPCICSLVAHTKIVRDIGAFDESIQHMYEDQVLLAKLCLSAPVYVEDGCGERYRQHPNSSSHIAITTGEYHPTKPNASRLAYLQWLEQYVPQLGIEDGALKKRIQKNLRPYRYPMLYRFIYPLQQLIGKMMMIAWRFVPSQATG